MSDEPSSPASPTLTAGFSRTTTGRAGEVAPALAAGTRLGTRYEIEALLGQGGMGAVYRARDLELGRVVALKVIRPDMVANPEALERFKREILLASQVTHRNVLRIHDLGEADEVRYISMQYVAGHDLKSILKREGPLPLDRALPLVRQIASALQAAHDAGVVHRDLKPQNILVDGQGQAFIADFGISRSVDAGGTMTETGMILGSVDYMAPEQARGAVPDHRADIYALGIILYEMFTGRLPFSGHNALSVMMRRVHEDAPSLRSVQPALPAWLDAVVGRALARDPADRYASATALLHDLETQHASRSWRRYRRPALWAGGAVVGAGALAAAAWIGFLAPRGATPESTPPPPQASLAILPFRNGTGDPRLDWVRDGLPNLLTADLRQWRTLRLLGEDRVGDALRGLGVAAAAPIPADVPPRLAGLVGVDATLHGGLVRAGERYRIDATLERPGGGPGTPFVVEGESEEAILGMVDDLSARVRDALGIERRLLERDRDVAALSSVSLEAIRLYHEGRSLVHSGQVLEGSRRLEAALQADAGFAVARAALAETYASLGQDATAVEEAERAVREAGGGTSSYEAARIRGVRARIGGDFAAAETAFAELVRLLPNDVGALLDLAGVQEEGGRLEDAARAAGRAAALDPKNPRARYLLGRIRYRLGRTTEALEDFNAALGLNLAVGNEEGRAAALVALGNACRSLGRAEDALRYYREALEVRERLKDGQGRAAALDNIALVLGEQGRTDEAIKTVDQAIAIRRDMGDRSGLAWLLVNRGDIQMAAGRPETALQSYQEGLKILRETGEEENLAITLASVGAVHTMMGRYLEAYYFLKEALDKRRAGGIQEEILASLVDIGVIEQIQGRYEEALRYGVEALNLARQLGKRSELAAASMNLANIHEEQGRYAAALTAADDAEKAAREAGHQRILGHVLIANASIRTRLGDRGGAARIIEDALALSREAGAAQVEAEGLIVKGRNLLDGGSRDQATPFLRQAEQIAARLKDPRLLLQARLYRAAAARDASTLAAVAREIQAAGLEPLLGQARLEQARLQFAAGRVAAAAQAARDALQSAEHLGEKDVSLLAHDLLAACARRLKDERTVADSCAVVRKLLAEVGAGLEGPFASALAARPLAGCRTGS